MFPDTGELQAQATEALRRHESAQEQIVQLLAQMLDQLGTSPITVAVTDTEVSPGAEVEFPVPGTARQTIKRSAVGGLISVTSAAAAVVLLANNRRLGCSIINKGTAGVTLYLCKPGDVPSGAQAQIWVGPGGGAWDGRLGNLLWCGNVSAVSDGATGNLAVTEV